jgi:hypothetical protein
MTDETTSKRFPKVGETVLFKSKKANEMGNGAEEVPAIVTRVWTEATVNLLVIRDGDEPLTRTSVSFEGFARGTHMQWRFRDVP